MGGKLDEKFLTTQQAARFLTNLGYPTTTAALYTAATRGDGPAYRIWRRIRLHEPSVLREWALSQLSAERRSTSEGDQQKRGR